MAYQTLLVHCPADESMAVVLAVATEIATSHKAHLVGLHVIPRIDMQYSYEIALVVSREFTGRRLELAAQLEQQFERATSNQGFVAEWRMVNDMESTVEEVVVEIGNTADLIIAPLAAEPSQRGKRIELGSRVLGGTGRPVLLVPPERESATLGERVFIAWDGQRASTRALFASLPMLTRASSVRLQRINAPQRDRHHAMGTTEELADTLSRHGVNVEVFHSDARDGEVSRELIGFARDWGADLIVSGAQEQGALREFLFGSTTRYLLEHSRVALLMSN